MSAYRALALVVCCSLLVTGCGTAEPVTPSVPATTTPEFAEPTGSPLPPAATLAPPAPALTQTPVPPPATRQIANPPITPTETRQPSPTPHPDLGRTWTRPADNAVMVFVPGASFQMGSTQDEIDAAFALCEEYRGVGNCRRVLFEDEAPAHRVTLDSFWIDRTEVTYSQYHLCVQAGSCRQAGCEDEFPIGRPVQPMGCVTWSDAEAYCRWAGGRLPTEAEWEYAARGPERATFPWGDTFDPSRLNYCDINCTYKWHDTSYDDGFSWPAPVGTFETGVSWCGAQDMAGNAWEWVADRYDPEYYTDSPIHNPQGPASGNDRVIRGGSAHFFPPFQRTANRIGISISAIYASGGFRCALTHRP